MSKLSIHRIMLLVLALVMLVASCAENENADESPTPLPSANTSPVRRPATVPSPSVEPEPDPEPEFINWLTGLEIAEEHVNSRPVVIMINNLREALPQFGLSCADIIYEIVAEGGITRLVMVAQDPSKFDVVGSVRSTRSYYLDLAQGHDGILLHAGASEMAYSEIKKRGVENIDGIYNSVMYYRDAARRKNNGYEHSLMTTGELIVSELDKSGYRLEHKDDYEYPVKFEKDVILNGKKADDVSVRFSQYKTANFTYDDESGFYSVSQYGKAHMDAGAEQQLKVKNVLVLYADITAIKGDAYGRMDVDLVGSGSGVYICNGEYVDIEWSKASYSSPFVYKNNDGSDCIFNQGTSYICVVSSDAALTIED